MKSQIKGRVFWVGSIGWNDHLPGEGLISHFHKSSSYNSYLIMGTHNFLIDTVSKEFADAFIENLSYELPVSDLYGIILTTDKSDHTGALPKILELNPEIKVFVSSHDAASVKKQLGKKSNIVAVNSGDSFRENGFSLDFIDVVPFGKRHALFSYIREERILFSGYATEYIIQDLLGPDGEDYHDKEPVHRRLQRRIGEKIGMPIQPDIICTNHGTPMFVV